MANFINHTSKFYRLNSPLWKKVDELYEGTAVINAPNNYLNVRKGTESKNPDVFGERADNAHYDGIYGEVIDSIIGYLLKFAERAERNWGSLGSPSDSNSPANKLWNDMNGEGTNYLMGVAQALSYSVKYGLFYSYNEGFARGADGEFRPDSMPSIKVYKPIKVPLYFDNRELLLEEHIRAGTVKDGEQLIRAIVHYERDGFTRYYDRANAALSGTSSLLTTQPEKQYIEPMTDEYGNEILPWQEVAVPLTRNIAYHMAHGAEKLFEFKSYLSYLYRVISLGHKFVANASNATTVDKMKKAIEEGSAFVWEEVEAKGGTRFIAPKGHETADSLKEWLEKEKDEYRKTFFKTVNNAARPNVTATEIIDENHRGLGAYVAIIAQTMSEWETNALKMVQRDLNLPDDAEVQWQLDIDVDFDDGLEETGLENR